MNKIASSRARLLAPLRAVRALAIVLLLLMDHLRSASAEAAAQSLRGLQNDTDDDLITNTADFVAAIQAASSDPANPSTIRVAVGATIDFDDGTTTVSSEGLDLSSKYFRAKCDGYDEDNKCSITRSAGGGRFFSGSLELVYDTFGITSHGDFSFTGFEFSGGRALLREIGTSEGGAFRLECQPGPCSASFTDCAFEDNIAYLRGGAVRAESPFSKPQVSLSFIRCTFKSNQGTGPNSRGGAIHAQDSVYLSIVQSIFSNNTSTQPGNDIYGRRVIGRAILECSETTTSTGTDNDVIIEDSDQTCSNTAVPSTSPSPSSSQEPSNLPSSSAVPSSKPSSKPSLSMLPTVMPSDVPSTPTSLSTGPSKEPSNQPSSSVEPSSMPSDQPSLSFLPTDMPSNLPDVSPAALPTLSPANAPTTDTPTTPIPSVPAPSGEAPSPEQCHLMECCQDECCGNGTSWSLALDRCIPDPSSTGWDGTYKTDYDPTVCAFRSCCERGCCGEGTSYSSTEATCLPNE